jgi:bacterioferritin (cytochrome b1)
MYELRLPTQAPFVTLQTALTRTLDAAVAYHHASRLSESRLLAEACETFADQRNEQADRIADLIAENGGAPDFGFSGEANFQQLWMTLVSRRFPTFREGLPRECERCDRRLERVLLRLVNDTHVHRHELGEILRDVRTGLNRLHSLRDPHALLPAMSR